MKRRNILVGIGTTALGGAALLGSGAFTRVESQRDVTVQVATDENAYLGLKPLDTPNSNNYVELDENGHLAIDVDEHDDFEGDPGGASPGLGVNSDSFTFFDGMFEVCNQGKDDACLSYELPGAPDGRAYGDDLIAPDPEYDEQVLTFYYISEGGDDPGEPGDRIFVQEGQTVPLALGECREMGLRTVTKGVDATLDAPLVDGEAVLTADVNGDCFDDPPPEELPVLTVALSIPDQCPDDPGLDIVGTDTTFDVTATVAETNGVAANNVTVTLEIPDSGISTSQNIGTLAPNASTTVTFSGVGPLDLGAYSPIVTAASDTAAADDIGAFEVIESCSDDGQSVTFEQFCADSATGEDENEDENENEGGSGGDYIYTYTYDYTYEKGNFRYNYYYEYKWSEDAEQDPNPTAPPVDETLACSEDGSAISPNPSPDPNPP